MSGLVPFNRLVNSGLSRPRTGFEDFYNMLDDFFSDGLTQGRSLMRDTFKIDIEENEDAYLIEAELPGVKKEEIDIGVDNEIFSISVNRSEEVNKETKNYVHRERRTSSMSRRMRLTGVDLDGIKANLENGVLSVAVPKASKASSARKIEIV